MASHEPYVDDVFGMQGRYINAKFTQLAPCLRANKLTANLVVCDRLFFQEQNGSPILSQSNGRSAASQTAADDDNLPPFYAFRHETP